MTAPNFARLDGDRPEIILLMIAMLQAREALSGRSWSHPLEYAGEEWWADVLADPRARRQARGSHSRGALNIYRLRDEPRAIILVACTKCDWKAAYSRDELIAPCQTCSTILPLRGAQTSAQTGIAAARILSSPSRGHDDHATGLSS